MLHFWEEPPLSGSNGSGAVFFSGCPLHCVYCQNFDISAQQRGVPTDASALAQLFLDLQRQGAHNLNLVTPTPHRQTILSALDMARAQGFSMPVVYNTSGYETLEALASLEGYVDIYLPDIKYVDSALSQKWSQAQDYFAFAAPAILEMRRQVGHLTLDEHGVARRGLLLRHLALPGAPDDTRRALDFVARQLGPDTHLSLMRQYTPMRRAGDYPPLHRRLSAREYDRAVAYALQLGLKNLYLQDAASADASYTPEF